MCAGAGDFHEVGWPSRSVGHARCKHRETDKPIGKPVIVFPAEPKLRVVWPSPHILHGRSPPRRELATCAARLRSAGRAFEDLPRCTTAIGCPITRCLRGLSLLFEASPLYWPIPPQWKPPRLFGRLSWDSSVRLSIDMLSEPGPLALPPPGRVGMPLPTHCRSRGFAPPQRLTVSRKVQACCILLPIMGFVAFHTACRSCGPGKPAAAHIAIPATLFVPLEESPRRQPHRVSAAVAFLRFHRPPGTTRPLSQPDRDTGRPRRFDGLWPTDCSADLHTSPGASSMTEIIASSPRHRSGPRYGRAPSPTLASRGGPRLDRESGPFQGLTPPTSSCFAHRIGYRRRQHGSSWASFPFKVLLPIRPCGRGPTPPPPKREGASSSDPSSCRRVPCTL
jgi:hypothetical protein